MRPRHYFVLSLAMWRRWQSHHGLSNMREIWLQAWMEMVEGWRWLMWKMMFQDELGQSGWQDMERSQLGFAHTSSSYQQACYQQVCMYYVHKVVPGQAEGGSFRGKKTYHQAVRCRNRVCAHQPLAVPPPLWSWYTNVRFFRKFSNQTSFIFLW